MRLWSLHPSYLDVRGLVALWREALLAQAVLAGETRGYRRHPQLHRFREHRHPEGAIAAYLQEVLLEAQARGFAFDGSRVRGPVAHEQLAVTTEQLTFERVHLDAKLRRRDPVRAEALRRVQALHPHPLFYVVPGPVAGWERRALDAG